jgi:hypothetical protein
MKAQISIDRCVVTYLMRLLALLLLLAAGPTFVTLRPGKCTLLASDSGLTPRRAQTAIFLSVTLRRAKSNFLSVS